MANTFSDFDEFVKCVSFDISDPNHDDSIGVMAIFSQGFIKQFDKEFVKSNPDVARKLTAFDLYNMIRKEFDENA